MKHLAVVSGLLFFSCCGSTAIAQQSRGESLTPQMLSDAMTARGYGRNASISGVDMADRMVRFNSDAAIFTDSTPAQPGVTGIGNTVGQQRTVAAQVATSLVESQLRFTQPIDIEFQTGEINCSVFASGTYNRSFVNGPGQIPDTVYPTALANQLSQEDRSGAGIADVLVTLNSNILDGQCNNRFNYLIDGSSQPVGAIDFIDLVVHEISHGLGFELRPSGEQLPFVYERFLFARDQNRVYGEMDAAQRSASAAKVKNLAFTGALTRQLSERLLRERRSLSVGNGPDAVEYEVIEAVGTPLVPSAGIRAPLVNLDFDTCAPEGDLAGKIVILPSGCAREELGLTGTQLGGIQLAEREGALAAVVTSGEQSERQTSFTSVSIPVVSVLFSEYEELRSVASNGAAARLTVDRGAIGGADERGQPFVYSGPSAPPGSSIIHYEPAISVNTSNTVVRALQEPVVSKSGREPVRRSLGFNVPALVDLGWAAYRCGNAQVDLYEQCDDGNAVSGDGCEQNCLLPQD